MVPGRIEAENFDPLGVFDSTDQNEGGEYRLDTAVDIKATADGYAVGWMTSGEYLEFTIDVRSEADYPVYVRAGAAGAGRTLTIEQCDKTLINELAIPNVPNWGQYKTVLVGDVHLTPGLQKIRISVGATDYMDLDWVQIGGEVDLTSNNIPDAVACEVSAGGSPTMITVDGNSIATNNRNGLTFKGFGVLSANSTSTLLMDYKAQYPEQYVELLKILFGGSRPIMNHVKIEMGNDRNNSTGPDPATMRWQDEPANVRRAPGFQLAADAKAINPSVKVSILRWHAPGWVKNNDQLYIWHKNTILAAYREYGYMVDYVNPGENERTPDLNWSKSFAARIKSDTNGFRDNTERALFNQIKTVISDESHAPSFGDAMVSDASLRDAVSVAAYHYYTDDDAGGNFKRLAEQFDMEVWNSEAQATFSNTSFRPNNNVRDPSVSGTGIGGANGPLEMGNTIIKGFVKSRRSHFIYQPAIGSFYEGALYSFKELVSARDPWSGWIHYDGGLQVLRHFSWFSTTGWENSDNSAGIWRMLASASDSTASGTNPVNGRNGRPNYVTLASPDKRHFSTVIINDSEQTQTYALSARNMAYAAAPALEVWETRARDAGEAYNANYMQYQCDLAADGGGQYRFAVKPYSVVTVTTLPNRTEAEFHEPLPVEGERTVLDTDITGNEQNTADNILYADDFDYVSQTVPRLGAGGEIIGSQDYVESRGGSQSAMPRYFSERNGVFEVFLPSGTSNYVLRQPIDQDTMELGATWHSGSPIAAVGDFRWLNYRASVDVSFETNNSQLSANYAGIGARQQGGSNSHFSQGTPYILKLNHSGAWEFQVDANAVASGNAASSVNGFATGLGAWHNLALEVVDNKVTAYIDDVKVAEYTDTNPRLSGRVDILSGYYPTRFDNLLVEKVPGKVSYYSEFLDNLEMHDLQPIPEPKLVYSGNWAHANGKSMYNYHRSLSTGQAGATLAYSFEGTGMDILGPNNGSANIEVTVDGSIVNASIGTMAANELYQTYTLRNLTPGAHTVSIRVLSGTLVVDAVGVVP